jgi:spermidine synthase
VLDTLRHSYVDLDDPTHLEFRYARIVADVLATLPNGPLRTLYVGGGGFTFPGYITATRPGSTHLVLELDASLVDIAERELGLVRNDDLVVEVGDARLGINKAPVDSFDFVLGDAFGGPSVPWHLTTEEFLTEVAARLTDDGMYVMNLIDYPPNGFARAELATVAAVFPHVLVIAPQEYLNAATGGNFVLVGSKAPISPEAVGANTMARNGIETVLDDDMARAWVGDAAVLRDDFAPVDQLMSR